MSHGIQFRKRGIDDINLQEHIKCGGESCFEVIKVPL